MDFYKQTITRDDGRTLYMYDHVPCTIPDHLQNVKFNEALAISGHSHRRWHPLRNEWVTYSAARQNRTFKPAANACPLCPSIDSESGTDIPLENFNIVVFDNKFPAFRVDTIDAPIVTGIDTAPAQGKCEVVVYTSQHEGNVGELSPEKLSLLVNVWADRYQDLRGKHNIKFVMPFENRGEEAGVTLHHPHGQIYAFDYCPPIIENAVKSFRQKNHIAAIIDQPDSPYIVMRDEFMTAFVPPFARYPYELWVAPNRFSPGLWDFSDDEKQSYATMIAKIVRLYDKFFERTAPYLYVMHAAPMGEDAYFHFSGQFYPLLRSPTKLKYLAGCEQGAGSFLSDVLPEDAAQTLRKALHL